MMMPPMIPNVTEYENVSRTATHSTRTESAVSVFPVFVHRVSFIIPATAARNQTTASKTKTDKTTAGTIINVLNPYRMILDAQDGMQKPQNVTIKLEDPKKAKRQSTTLAMRGVSLVANAVTKNMIAKGKKAQRISSKMRAPAPDAISFGIRKSCEPKREETDARRTKNSSQKSHFLIVQAPRLPGDTGGGDDSPYGINT